MAACFVKSSFKKGYDLMNKNILEVRDLCKYYPLNQGFLALKKYFKAINNITLSIKKGETLGVVGESGCGKSTLISLS